MNKIDRRWGERGERSKYRIAGNYLIMNTSHFTARKSNNCEDQKLFYENYK